jgi:hypothetical protein
MSDPILRELNFIHAKLDKVDEQVGELSISAAQAAKDREAHKASLDSLGAAIKEQNGRVTGLEMFKKTVTVRTTTVAAIVGGSVTALGFAMRAFM